MVSVNAPAGSVILFHPQIVHGSAQNISPHSRDVLIITYNETSNVPQPVGLPRPEYLVGQDSTPLVACTGLHLEPMPIISQ